jgi:hypothetical protein
MKEVHMRFLTPALAAAIAVAAPALPDDQVHFTLDWPTGQPHPYAVDSGASPNPGLTPAVVFQEVIRVEDAAFIRVYFDQADLEDRSFLRITSLLDGEVQELDSAAVMLWSNASAYFNGDAVLLELIAAPGTKGNRVVVSRLDIGAGGQQPLGGSGQCGICGATDDRVPSSELWTARLFPAGCTASVFQTDSCMVSAGHCVGGSMVVQFNVPNSTAGCVPVNPPIADQFPIIDFEFNSNGVGDDWSVLIPGNNNLGQNPYERYGQLRPISLTAATAGTPVSLTGYGVDLTCVLSQTQQTADGTICTAQATFYTFNVDLRGGNSGSALIRESDQTIIGIATHCPCCNVATRVTNADFVLARGMLCPPPESGVTTLPFMDDFPTVELDPSLWTGVDGAEGSTRGIDEPSPTLSLNLDATNPGGDEARSAIMNTTGQTGLRLNYWYERTGTDDSPETGDDLVVEYRNATGNWVEINRHLGSGPDMTAYEFVSIVLPAGALHSTFRLRLRAISGESGSEDDWFVDDVCIGQLADCPLPPPTGACCLSDGSCQTMTAADCAAAGGTYQGDTTLCSPDPCPDPTGACCMSDGSCLTATAAECAGAGGTYQGDNTSCVPDPCPDPMGACCMSDGSCQSMTAANCAGAGGTYLGDDTSCVPDPCPDPTGACCMSDGSCLTATAAECAGAGGTYLGDDTGCAPNPCPAPCPWDTAGPGGGDPDGDVGINDLLDLLAHWGPCPGGPCPWDTAGPGGGGPDGDVGINDLLDLLAHWGPCP